MSDVVMKKFKIKCEKIFYSEEVVEAEDYDHAIEIAGEYTAYEMEVNYQTEIESSWDAVLVGSDVEVTYEPR